MDYFLKVNKNILTYSLILLILIPIFGINFVFGLLSNFLLLLFLIPLLVILLVFLGFTYYKSKIKRNIKVGMRNNSSSMLPKKLIKKLIPKIGIIISNINE